MSNSDLVVAGHVCVDIAPEFHKEHSFDQVFCPGRLSMVGAATIAPGGTVANTGVAAHKLGLNTVLMGKIGEDSFGAIIRDCLTASGARLAMNVSPDVSSSYSVVLNLAGMDRIFLHHSGANDCFFASDIDFTVVKESKLFHFGYPPLMKSMYANKGQELVTMMKKVKQLGVTTSLDMAMPDPNADSGRVDWKDLLKSAAPYIDIFLPSYEELFFMLAPNEYLEWRSSSRQQDLSEQADFGRAREFARELQDWGMGIIVIKVGKNGIYLRTPNLKRLQTFGGISVHSGWADCELWAESCKPKVFISSTGAGDCAIAGFLTALIRGCNPQDSIQLASIAGYQNLRAVDAVSGLISWDELLSDLHHSELQYNELDLKGFGFKRIKRGLWGLS